MELMVISDIPNTSENVGQDTTLKGDLEWVAILADSEDRALLRSLSLAISYSSYSTGGYSSARPTGCGRASNGYP